MSSNLLTQKKHLKCVSYADRFTHGGTVGCHIG